MNSWINKINKTPKILKSYPLEGLPMDIAWSPDGRFLSVAYAENGNTPIWDIFSESRIPMRIIRRPGGSPAVVRFTSDSRQLIAGPTANSDRYGLAKYDIRTGEVTAQAEKDAPNIVFGKIDISDNGKFVAVNMYYSLHLLHVEDLSFYKKIEQRVICSSFSRDSNLVFIATRISAPSGWRAKDGRNYAWGAINVYDLAGNLVKQITDGDSRVNQISFDGHGNILYIGRSDLNVVGSDSTARKRSDPNRLVARNVNNGELLFSFQGKLWEVSHLSSARTNSLLASSSEDGIVRLWNSNTGELYLEVERDVKGGFPLAFNFNGEMLAYCTRHTVHIVSVV